jgi:hypothetical protein
MTQEGIITDNTQSTTPMIIAINDMFNTLNKNLLSHIVKKNRKKTEMTSRIMKKRPEKNKQIPKSVFMRFKP